MTKFVVKLGGSVITDKKGTKDFPKDIGKIIQRSHEFIKVDALGKIGQAISSAKTQNSDLQLVLLNGAGPFGHKLVYAHIKGDKGITPDLVHQSVEHLNYEVVCSLRKAQVQTVSIHPFNTCSFDGKDYSILGLWTIANAYLCKGNVPISYGDLVPTIGCKGKHFELHEVISGDDLVVKIAKEWRADKVIMVTDVRGLYNEDPTNNPSAELIPRISVRKKAGLVEDYVNEMQKYGIEFSQSSIDVTKGFSGKTFKLYKSTYETGIKSQACNVDGLEAALKGKDAGTVFVKT